jgi:hypothetical protein
MEAPDAADAEPVEAQPDPMHEHMRALTEQMGKHAEATERLHAELTAPKVIMRDDAGRAVGMQTGSRAWTLDRDETGRATGLRSEVTNAA